MRGWVPVRPWTPTRIPTWYAAGSEAAPVHRDLREEVLKAIKNLPAGHD